MRQYRRCRHRPDLIDLPPKIYLDLYLKSYCCLWNLDLIKKHDLSFCMGDRNPGYAMQDSLEQLGYKLVALPTRRLFRYVDHTQSGTMAEIGEHSQDHRRSKAYRKLLRRFGKNFDRATTTSQLHP